MKVQAHASREGAGSPGRRWKDPVSGSRLSNQVALGLIPVLLIGRWQGHVLQSPPRGGAGRAAPRRPPQGPCPALLFLKWPGAGE